MKNLDNQTAFNIAAGHMLRQNKKAHAPRHNGGAGMCKYITPAGLRCPVGALLPAEWTRELMHCGDVGSLIGEFPRVEELFRGVNKVLLTKLQATHDTTTTHSWRFTLENIAALFHLTTEALCPIQSQDSIPSSSEQPEQEKPTASKPFSMPGYLHSLSSPSQECEPSPELDVTEDSIGVT